MPVDGRPPSGDAVCPVSGDASSEQPPSGVLRGRPPAPTLGLCLLPSGTSSVTCQVSTTYAGLTGHRVSASSASVWTGPASRHVAHTRIQ